MAHLKDGILLVHQKAGCTNQNGAPSEDKVDNPGNWKLFSFAAKHALLTKRYEGHVMPANVKVVMLDSSSNRKVKDWIFFYRGWTACDLRKVLLHKATRRKGT